MRRYPQVFENAQVTDTGIVYKVLSQTGTHYELLLWSGDSYFDEDRSELLLIRGDVDGALFIDGDALEIYGVYRGIETVSVDGTSLTIPVIDVYDAYLYQNRHRFDYTFIKSVAKSVFGENIEVRKLQGEEAEFLTEDDPYYVVELENQSNAKLSTYYFDTDSGMILDETLFDWESPIERHIEFSSDLKHFYVISYDHSLYTFTVECYDTDLNKVWKREFEEVQPLASEGLMDRIYDYTKNNFYLAINNEFYIINALTGENTVAPTYVGAKIAVSKMRDGILLIASGKADSIMKLGLDGTMLWRSNTNSTIVNIWSLQATGENIVIHTLNGDEDEAWGDHYYVVNSESGTIVIDAIELQ